MIIIYSQFRGRRFDQMQEGFDKMYKRLMDVLGGGEDGDDINVEIEEKAKKCLEKKYKREFKDHKLPKENGKVIFFSLHTYIIF
jgi:hypothetical protein